MRIVRFIVSTSPVKLTKTDLIGGFRLVNGDTVWVDGAAVLAAKEGAILLLDEIDLGGPALMCLQPLLEGNAIYVKKTGEWVTPKLRLHRGRYRQHQR